MTNPSDLVERLRALAKKLAGSRGCGVYGLTEWQAADEIEQLHDQVGKDCHVCGLRIYELDDMDCTDDGTKPLCKCCYGDHSQVLEENRALQETLVSVAEILRGVESGVTNDKRPHKCSGYTCSLCGWQSLAGILDDILRKIEEPDDAGGGEEE